MFRSFFHLYFANYSSFSASIRLAHSLIPITIAVVSVFNFFEILLFWYPQKMSSWVPHEDLLDWQIYWTFVICCLFLLSVQVLFLQYHCHDSSSPFIFTFTSLSLSLFLFISTFWFWYYYEKTSIWHLNCFFCLT